MTYIIYEVGVYVNILYSYCGGAGALLVLPAGIKQVNHFYTNCLLIVSESPTFYREQNRSSTSTNR